MLFNRALSLLVASVTIHQCAANEEAGANELPILLKQEFSTVEYGALEKRDTCPGGGRCIIGTCCGDGCAQNCCGHDEGGVGCGIAQRCQFDGNVFIGCCANLIGGCTGTPTMVTIHTPYRTVPFRTGDDDSTTYAPAIPTTDVSSVSVSTDVDSGLRTATVASTRTTSTSTFSNEDILTTTAVESSTATSSEIDLSTSETTSSDASAISNDLGSEPSSAVGPEATASDSVSDDGTTPSSGGVGRNFSGMGMGAFLAIGALFLGTA